jgi:hypothetical protein
LSNQGGLVALHQGHILAALGIHRDLDEFAIVQLEAVRRFESKVVVESVCVLEGDGAGGVLAVVLLGGAVARGIGQHEVTIFEAVHLVLTKGAVGDGDGVEGDPVILRRGDASRRSSTMLGVEGR